MTNLTPNQLQLTSKKQGYYCPTCDRVLDHIFKNVYHCSVEDIEFIVECSITERKSTY